MELPGTTPHAKARIALAKLLISLAREELILIALGDRVPEEKQARLASGGTLAERAIWLEGQLNDLMLNPQGLLEKAYEWTQGANEQLPRALLVEPIAPGYGTTPEALRGHPQ